MPVKFVRRIEAALGAMDAYPSQHIDLFHHNDTDGLTAGAILCSALERAGYTVAASALEKPYPLVLQKIFERRNRIVIFADFAGKIAPMIAGLNRGGNLVLIVDHHPAEEVDDPSVYVVDADLFGLKGDRDISASATCYVVAEGLAASNRDLAHLGALGAVGDGFFVDGALSGVNRSILKEAQDQGTMRTESVDFGERYYMRLEQEYPADQLCSTLDTLGGVGYYQGGAAKGRELCRQGFTLGLHEEVQNLLETRKRLFDQEIERLRSQGPNTTAHLQWFDVEERFRPMGVKMIGVFCTVIRNMDFLDPHKYLAGFQTLPDEVPGFGEIAFNSKKISMRVSDFLTDEIRAGRKPGLSAFLPEATIQIGGFADACHGLSAATTVPIGREQELIEETERVLSKEK
ncbi:MAG: hypothetical protein K9M94_14740 [Spirochaetia bacterium]|nr:hypothetical protein [Spirochaetia bacterium]